MQRNTVQQMLRDLSITAGLLVLTTILTFILFFKVSDNPANIALFYIIGIITISKHTSGYFYGILASAIGVIFINCFFTYPYFTINFSPPDYPFTFLCMLALSMVTSATTSHLKSQAELLASHEKELMEAEKEKLRANLLRAVSHDLRTPLTGILGASASLEEQWENYESTERQELIHNIHDDANWLLNMVENLLSVTQIQTEGSQLNTTLEVVDEVVAESVTRLKKRLPDADIHITLPPEILLVPMDAMLIEQVLINLMENALLHSHSEHPIEFIVENHTNNVYFRIIDYGVGLKEEHLNHIFDGTYSENVSSDGSKGIGIGLSICYSIITAHHGTITARNHDKGAEFLCILPKEKINA